MVKFYKQNGANAEYEAPVTEVQEIDAAAVICASGSNQGFGYEDGQIWF